MGMLPGIHSFQTKLALFFMGLLTIVLSAIYLAVNDANTNNARTEIQRALVVGVSTFKKDMNSSINRLLDMSYALSSDYAFKRAVADNHHATMLSAMNNHLDRVPLAELMMLVSLDNRIIANVLEPDVQGVPNPWSWLVKQAEKDEYLEADSIIMVNNKMYQVMVVPLLAPEPVAWIFVGFRIDDRMLQELKEILLTDISVLSLSPEDDWHLQASTLTRDDAAALTGELTRGSIPDDQPYISLLQDQHFVTYKFNLLDTPNMRVVTVLQRSFDEAMAPYRRLNRMLFIIFTIGMIISVASIFLLARTVTRPVKKLSLGVTKIEQGDYDTRVEIQQKDEIGQLGHAFNNMARGLAEKEKVRNLLGKVVSPEIAEELMSKDLELGGEDREVTILFSDVRGFTTLCEGLQPQVILNLLNRYLTAISTVIEEHGGVVDKYIGDAVMALFGAPLQHDDDPARAIKTALGMCQALAVINQDFINDGLPPIGIGIGINTDTVVAGNMGSMNRLNYTVIGDGVNLASRLEGLTKQYGVHVIVSDNTRTRTDAFIFRELDMVRVKGKDLPVGIFEPVDVVGNVQPETLQALQDYEQALVQYRRREWRNAVQAFRRLHEADPARKLYKIYLDRCQQFIAAPPPADWDGAHTFTSK
jgi:adenylate cyclase